MGTEKKIMAVWFFRVYIQDTMGTIIAEWQNEKQFPVIPPRFTYPNNDPKSPYIIGFRSFGRVLTQPLETNMDINLAIDRAIRNYIKGEQ